MSEGVALAVRRNACRFALTGLVGIWLSGCADATRFADSGSPFSNPFSSASNDAAAPTPRVSSQPLASARPAYSTAARPSPSAVASSSTPAPEATGAIRARPEPVGGSASGWTAVGGSPIVVGSNDDAATLSARYGVPEAALLSANGFRSRSDVRPGARIVVPVYNAAGHSDARVARQESRSDDEADAKPRHAKHEADADDDTRRTEKAKKRKARSDDDADADDDAPRKSKKTAKADDERDRTPKSKASAKADDGEAKPARGEKVAKSEPAAAAPAKPGKPQKGAADVAKADPPKSSRKTDDAPTGAVAPAAADGDKSAENGQFRWPARGRIIQGFKTGGNDGINIALPEGTSVRAAEDGKVAYAGSALKGYGNLVLIRHTNGFVTAYANNGELNVKSGDMVKRGQVIAKSGQSGDVSTPQLHFELRKGQTPVDPTNYLAGL